MEDRFYISEKLPGEAGDFGLPTALKDKYKILKDKSGKSSCWYGDESMNLFLWTQGQI